MNEPSRFPIPDYSGGSLVNLVAELEWRLTGSAAAPRLHGVLAARIPAADTYILLLIDGLGSHQLDHPAASSLARAHHATIDAPFPTTTTVGLACVATGHPPSRHGFNGHFVMLAGYPRPVNGLRWKDSTGKAVPPRASCLLAAPNLWERLRAAGVEPVTVQPASFAGSAFTKVMYRGCRFEGVNNTDESARAALDLAAVPRRLVFVYYPLVDVAAHMHGPRTRTYARAMSGAAAIWDHIAARLPTGVVMIGTADHGVVPIPASGKFRLYGRDAPGLTLFGDPRCLYVRGAPERIERLRTRLPAAWYPREALESMWGPPMDPVSAQRRRPVLKPAGAFLADRGRVILPGHMDKRLVGYHGGLDPRELRIPLLVAEP